MAYIPKLPALALLFCMATATAAAQPAAGPYTSPDGTRCSAPVDPGLTPETYTLYKRLCDLRGKGTLFGHHFTNMWNREGVSHQEYTYSDVVASVGDYPAVFGFDFINGCDSIYKPVMAAARLGAVVTISHHMGSPFGDETFYVVDTSRQAVRAILPGGEKHAFLLEQLDSIAAFANRIRINGELYPIIYRPWHEHNGKWFWWGCDTSTPEEYVALWRFTVEYLRDVKQVHNFLYAFSPSNPVIYGGYETRNPGAEWFDIAGFDSYRDKDFGPMFLRNVKEVAAWARAHGKIAACTEFGVGRGIANTTVDDWYMTELLDPVKADPYGRDMVMLFTWANRKPRWWVPLPGDIYWEGFRRFHDDPYTLFLEDWKQNSEK